MKRPWWQWLICLLAAMLALQIFFLARIVSMLVLNPASTSFQRSEAWRLGHQTTAWRQQWLPYEGISANLKRAVIAAEDDSFTSHDGLDWSALETAWRKNSKAQAKADQLAQQPNKYAPTKQATSPKLIGGSTITQQLAKNLFLSGERTLFRKAQEFVLTLAIELVLDKRRILEIYLNSVEWGEGVFGAEAAARHYFGKSAAQLGAYEAARMAVMLPRPKYFQKNPESAFLSERADVMVSRMDRAVLP